MRASVASFTKKFISTFFAATLALGLVPATAFAEPAAAVAENGGDASASSAIQQGDESPRYEDQTTSDKSQDEPVADASASDVPSSAGTELAPPDGEEGTQGNTQISGDENLAAVPAGVINQTMPLQVVTQQESTRSYFLAQTLESTRTVPIVSANLPLDKSANKQPQAGADGGAVSSSEDKVTSDDPSADAEGEGFPEDEGGDDSDESDPANGSDATDDPEGTRFDLVRGEDDSAVSAESTVVGSFTYCGMTFAVEPGGESVALVAVDYSKLPSEFVKKQVLVIPEAATADGIDYYSVTRIATNAFSSLIKETADPDHAGCIALFSDEDLLAEAGIDSSEIQAFLDTGSDAVDIDGDGEPDAPVNPLKDCAGILAAGIPASVTNIEDDAFAGADTLQYLVVSEDNPEYASYDGVLYSADLANLRLIPEGRVGAVRVAPSATAVDPEVFSHCPSVTTVVADPESEVYRALEEANLSTYAKVLCDEDANNFQNNPTTFGLITSNVLDVESRNSSSASARPYWHLKVQCPFGYSLIENQYYNLTLMPEYSHIRHEGNASTPYVDFDGVAIRVFGEHGSGNQYVSLLGPSWLDGSEEWYHDFYQFQSLEVGRYITNNYYYDAALTRPVSPGLNYRENMYLYLGWGYTQYKLTYKPGDGTGTDQSASGYTINDSVKLPTDTFSKPGYWLSGWKVGGVTYGSDRTFGIKQMAADAGCGANESNSEIVLTAQWSPTSYKLTYKPGDGTGTDQSASGYTINDSVKLPTDTFSKPGYWLSGWKVGGVTYESGRTFGIKQMAIDAGCGANESNSEIVLTAQWSPTSYKLTYKPGDGTGTDQSASGYTINDSVKLPTDTFSKPGYWLSGWKVGRVTYESGRTFGIKQMAIDAGCGANESNSEIVLTAQWSPNSYTVNYWNKAGTSLLSSATFTYDQVKKLAATPASGVNIGYTAIGWSTSKNSSSKTYNFDSLQKNLAASGIYDLYLAETANTYTVIYNGNGETSGSMAPYSHTYDEAKNLSANAFTKTGYSFAGWNTSRDGSGDSFTDGASVVNLTDIKDGTVTLYAQWAPKSVTLKLDANNGHGDIIREGVPVTWDAIVPVLDGLTAASIMAAYEPAPKGSHTFEGFYTEALGGMQYYDAELKPVSAFTHDIDTLYVHWRDNRDIHNHVYCSSGVPGNFDSDGFAYGWTCPSWDTYKARVYVADSVTPNDAQANHFGVPTGEQSKISGKISVDAVKAGEYVLLAGGYQKEGWLPTDRAGTDWETYKGAWWEITAKPGESLGTLRIHSDGGAKIIFDAKSDGSGSLADLGAHPAWRTREILSKVSAVFMDHVDAAKTSAWFSNSSEMENQIRTVELRGNTWPPSCVGVSRTFFNNEHLYGCSDNMTLAGLTLDETLIQDALFHTNVSLASLPKNFRFVLPSKQVNAYSFRSCINLLALPDAFRIDGSPTSGTGQSVFDLNSNKTIIGLIHGGIGGYAILGNTGRLGSDKLAETFYAGADAKTKTEITKSYGTIESSSTYSFRKLNASTSVTWDARGGSFSPSYTAYDTSRAYALTQNVHKPMGVGTASGFTDSSKVVVPQRKNIDGSADEFIGWYKKVPMNVNGHDANWAEKRYLYDYEFVWDGRSDEPVTVNNVNESIVYYAMYASDADELKSTIALKMNDGTDDTFKTIEGQIYGAPLKEDAGIPDFVPYAFDGFWTDPVGGTQYYGADGKAMPGVTWRELESSATLYAHWRYRIVFDANPAGCAELLHKAPDMPAHPGTSADDAAYQSDSFGNRYYYSDLAGGNMDVVSVSAVFGAPVKLPYAVGRTGYAEACAWSTASDASSDTLPVDAGGFTLASDGSTERAMPAVTPGASGSVTLYADWTDLASSSTMDLLASDYEGFAYAGLPQKVLNDASRTKSVTAVFDSTLPSAKEVAPVMRGYSFLGYFAEPQEEAVMGTSDPDYYAPSTMYYAKDGEPTDALWKAEGDRALYAHYRQIPYTLSFEMRGEGAFGDTSSVEVFYGYDLGNAPVHGASRPGFSFLGWNTAPDGSGEYYFDSEGHGMSGLCYPTEGNATLYPVWKGKEYSITWMLGYEHQGMVWSHCEGDGIADGAMKATNLSYGDEVDIPDPLAYSIAYGFHGWYVDAESAVDHADSAKLADNVYFVERDGRTYLKPADDASCPRDVVLYAGWDTEPIDYTITLRAGAHGSFPGGDTEKALIRHWTGDPTDDVDLAAFAATLSKTDPGWMPDEWVEIVDGKARPYDGATVPCGTGYRTFEMTWKVDADHDYTVTFSRGPEVSDSSRLYDFVYLRGVEEGRPIPFDAAMEESVSIPALVKDGAPVTETLGYAFEGWHRAVLSDDGTVELVEGEAPLSEPAYTGQELARMAEAAGTDSLYYVAKWTPKPFEVRYRYETASDSAVMDVGSYDARSLAYDETATLAAPVFEQTGRRGSIFSRWEGASASSVADPLLPGRQTTVSDLVKKVGSASVEKVEGAPDIVWLHAEWTPAYSFTVPLLVNIAIDPDRPEGTLKGEAWIETDSEQEVFVESASLTRADGLSETTLVAKGADRSADVYLSVLGDATDAPSPLLMNLGPGATNVHGNLAGCGFGTLKANGKTPGRVNLVYDLALREGSGLSFRDFENLVSIKDAHDASGDRASYTIGRVFYTLSLTRDDG